MHFSLCGRASRLHFDNSHDSVVFRLGSKSVIVRFSRPDILFTETAPSRELTSVIRAYLERGSKSMGKFYVAEEKLPHSQTWNQVYVVWGDRSEIEKYPDVSLKLNFFFGRSCIKWFCSFWNDLCKIVCTICRSCRNSLCNCRSGRNGLWFV